MKILESSEGNVWKYIFHFQSAIAEAVPDETMKDAGIRNMEHISNFSTKIY